MLKVEGLSAHYGGIHALQGIDLEVPDGAIVSLIGANGAGKSTTLKSIVGLVKASSGAVTWNGERLTGLPDQGHRVPRGVPRARGAPGLPQPHGGREPDPGRLLPVATRPASPPTARRSSASSRACGAGDQKAGTLSGGEQQMLAVGRALMTRPEDSS